MSERTADIDRARDALARQAWAEVLDALQGVDPDRLSPQDLEGFADAAWWMSRWDGSTAARQRAYAGYAAAGQDPQAGFNAVLLCFDHLERGDPSVAMGWLMRAQRHLADHEPCVQQGFLALCQAAVAQHGGDLEAAMTLAERAHQIGGRFDHRDVIALALLTRGQVLISMGRGVALGAPGLYFVGLPFQYAAASDVLPGVGRDAAYIAKVLVERRSYPEPALAARSA